MSKKISFKGQLDEGLEEKLKLSTLKGKTGYRIHRFDVIMATPGASDYECTVKVYAKAQGSGSTDIDFTESDLLAVAYLEDGDPSDFPMSKMVIFDSEVFNQDIFVNTASRTGTVPVNYYIELETVELTDLQSTQLTLKSLRQIASR
jgi:hypothetical protein